MKGRLEAKVISQRKLICSKVRDSGTDDSLDKLNLKTTASLMFMEKL